MHLGNVPECVRFLLACTEKHNLTVVSKFFQACLCFQVKQPFCFVSTQNNEEQVCKVSVNQDTARTKFLFKSGSVDSWELSQAGGMIRVAVWDGTLWMIKPVDDQHVKIFTENDNVNFSIYPFSHSSKCIFIFLVIFSSIQLRFFGQLKWQKHFFFKKKLAFFQLTPGIFRFCLKKTYLRIYYMILQKILGFSGPQ